MTARQETKNNRSSKQPEKIKQNNNSKFLPIKITLNVNGLNSPIRRNGMTKLKRKLKVQQYNKRLMLAIKTHIY